MKNYENQKIGLVLSGGGAKGAYQIGLLRALLEAGIRKEQLVMAGTSIGAINALLYALYDVDAIRKFMKAMSELVGKVREGNTDVFEPYCNLFKEFFPDEKLRKNTIPVTVCAYSVEKERPEYFKLQEMSPEDQRLMVRASSSLPAIAPPVLYQDGHYMDGGVVPIGCRNPMPPDKIPLSALKGIRDIDTYIVSFLKPEDRVDHAWIGDGKGYLESRPSVPLEDHKDTGTLDFSKGRLMKSEEMGYRETLRLLQDIQV